MSEPMLQHNRIWALTLQDTNQVLYNILSLTNHIFQQPEKYVY